MADLSDSPKTESPTPARRRESRRKGQVAFSSDLSNGLLLLSGAAILWFGGRDLGARLAVLVRNQLLGLSRADGGSAATIALAKEMLGEFLGTAGLVAAAVFLATLTVGFLQAGFHLTLEPLNVDWERVSFTKGWSRLLSVKSGVRGVMTLGKASIIALLIWWLFDIHLPDIAQSSVDSLLQAVSLGWSMLMKAAVVVGGVLTLLGVFDYGFQRWKHEQDLRMTRQEVKDEHKREEGDPHLRARIRKLQREIAQRQMFSDLPTATVVLTNPTHIAVAIRYDRSSSAAPTVVAKGGDHLAKRIVGIARDHGIPVIENRPLARTLFKAVEIGQEIPASLYQAVAEILARIYSLSASA